MPGLDVVDIVQAHRRQLVEAMQDYTRFKEDAGETEVGLLLVADAEIFRLDAVIRWLDAAEARIKRLPTLDDVQRRRRDRGRGAGWGHGDDPALELRRVSKSFGQGPTLVEALRSVDLVVHRASWWRSWARADRARARC